MITRRSGVPQGGGGGFDIGDPHHRIAAIYRLTQMGLSAPSHIIGEGRQWYREAHEHVAHTAREAGVSMETAAGITSALSPASDWKRQNIPAVGEAVGLHPRHWEEIAGAWHSDLADIARRREAGETGMMRPSKHPEIKEMLTEHAPHLANSSMFALMRGYRMLHGKEHPLDVLTRETSPKTRAFYGGIMEPMHRRGDIPIDYRMYDLIRNEMWPQKQKGAQNRRIERGSFARASMGKTRYEHAEDIVGAVGTALREVGGRRFSGANAPLAAQALLWVQGKHHELNAPGSKASRLNPGERFSGPRRTGQRYMDEHGNLVYD